jgi:hypothetical protein
MIPAGVWLDTRLCAGGFGNRLLLSIQSVYDAWDVGFTDQLMQINSGQDWSLIT